ncbi:MAG TPA: type II secretion system secretin GspD, partial [Azospirillaceae bacterium]|nr:type II secretion system secretin GspD [Azospirillaceae bacterium]
ADIRDVIKAILGTTLKENYVIDPGVKGAVTIQTSRPMTTASLLPTLEEILRLNGATLLRTADGYLVQPLQSAAARPAFRAGSEDGTQQIGWGIQVLPLHHVSAAEMLKTLKSFLPNDKQVSAVAQRNLLMVTGTRAEIAAIEELVELFDVDWLAGMSFGLFPVESARVEDMTRELDMVFGTGGEGPLAGMVRFVPIPRIKAVLAITARPDHLRKVQSWIADLDQAAEGEEDRVFVYRAQNGEAADLVATLNGLFGTGAAAPAGPSLAPGETPAEIGSGPMVDAGTVPKANGDGTAPAADDGMQPAAYEPSAGPTSAGAGGGRMRIVADKAKNAVVVYSTPREYRLVEETLRQIDTVPMQVLIEATVIEVTLNNELRYGVQWFFKTGASQFILSQAGRGTVSPIFPGFNYLLAPDADVRVVLNALASVTDLDVLSAPQLMVLDNQKARLQVGDQVPIAVQSAVSVINPDAPIVNTVQFRDTGVILEVSPRIGAGGMVLLDVSQEVSDVAPTTSSGIDSPTIQQRRVRSTVGVQTGETVMIGGLIRNSRRKMDSGVPILSALPVLGALFGAKGDNASRTELLVLITPRIVRSPMEARQLTEELRSRFHRIAPPAAAGVR